MRIKKKNLQIAIDGPIGAGKSILAFNLAKKLDMTYIYSGVMYRGVAYLGLKNKIPLSNEKELLDLIKNKKLELKKPSKRGRYTDIYLNGKDITNKLFSQEVTDGSSKVAKLKGIREYLVKLQKNLAKNRPVVMDGRDITTRVLPQADLKIFLTADLMTRVKRRWFQLKKIDKPKAFKKVLEEIKRRDYLDAHRKESPLKIAPDAWVLDNKKLSVKQMIDVVIAKLKEKDLIE